MCRQVFSHLTLIFTTTEDDSQPDCSCLLQQCSIRHGELLEFVSLNTHMAEAGVFLLVVNENVSMLSFLPSFLPQGDSHPVGALCDFQACWLTYFGKTNPPVTHDSSPGPLYQ